MSLRRLVIAGGSGFIGRALAREFTARGFAVVVLTRTPHPREDGVLEIPWDGVGAGAWAELLEGAEAVINLAGKSINCPHTPANLRDITASRVDSVQAIAAALGRAEKAPCVWVQASAVAFYGDTGAEVCGENAPVGNDTLAKVCRQWEGAFAAAKASQTRKVILRIGLVLGRDGGALPALSKLTRGFLGGAAGGGRQYVSWIHLADLVAMFVAVVEDAKLTGTFNAVGPRAVTNSEPMRELRRVLHRPWCPPAPGAGGKTGGLAVGFRSVARPDKSTVSAQTISGQWVSISVCRRVFFGAGFTTYCWSW